MDASEARRLTNEAAAGPAIDAYTKVIDKRIRKEAANGSRQIGNLWAVFSNLRMPSPKPEHRAAIFAYYLTRGFVVKDHPDPDPGHPCSGPYTTLEW